MSKTVTLSKTTETFTVEPHESILDAGLRQGFSLPYGCRNGGCGSCKGRIISGQVIYHEPDLPGIEQAEIESGQALFCKAHAVTDLEIDVRLAETDDSIMVRKLPCRVMHIDKLNHDVMRLKLKLPKTERLMFQAGQYIDIIMSDGNKRSFSLANAPHDDEFLELHIRHYAGGLFSEYAFGQMQEKALLRIEGPLGSFFLREASERPIIMVAGGTGFAPIKSIMEHILQSELERSIHFYWGARTRSDLYLHELAEGWADQHELITYTPVLSEATDEDNWQGATGFVHEQVLKDYEDVSGFDVYTCGPPPMTQAVCEEFHARGLSQEFIYSDSFEFAARQAGE